MLLLKRATPEQVKYACLKFHYARSVPSCAVAYSVYDNEEWCGVVVFGAGANNNIPKSFGKKSGEVLELCRVALNGKHTCPTSKVISVALRLVRKDCPLVKIIVSYADFTNQNHEGIIYKASNWLRLADSKAKRVRLADGTLVHVRSLESKYGHVEHWPAGWQWGPEEIKYKYIYNLRR